MSKSLSFVFEIVKVVVLALVIVLPIRYFIFQPFVVRGVSMEPNFHNGDYLIIDEITYRFREPFRGEVIVFKYPQNTSEKFIKRIIGLPNEDIEFKENMIFITDSSGEKIILDETEYIPNNISFSNKKVSLDNDQYFVMGDNRLHSFDSRNWGVLEKQYIVGRTVIRAFPPKDMCCFAAPAY